MSALTQTADTLFGVGNRDVREHAELRQVLELPRMRRSAAGSGNVCFAVESGRAALSAKCQKADIARGAQKSLMSQFDAGTCIVGRFRIPARKDRLLVDPLGNADWLEAALPFHRIADRLPRLHVEDFRIPDHDRAVDDYIGNAGQWQAVLARLIGGVVGDGFGIEQGQVRDLVDLDPTAILHVLKAGLTEVKRAPVAEVCQAEHERHALQAAKVGFAR
jgi:hypothetical protein